MTKQKGKIEFCFAEFMGGFESQANNQGYTLGIYCGYFDRLFEAYFRIEPYMSEEEEKSIKDKINKALIDSLEPLEVTK